MAEPQEPNDSTMTPNFADAMHSLAEQAERTRPTASSETAPSATSAGGISFSSKNGNRQELLLALGHMLKPIAVNVESMTRVTMETRQTLARLADAGPPLAGQALTPGQAQTFESIAQHLNRSASVESANQKLFDAMHAELKGYKDGFLFDALQRPFIRDLINVYDELEALYLQVGERMKNADASDPFVETLAENLHNTLSHVVEILERLDVVPQRTASGEPLDKKVHRIVGIKPVTSPEQNGQVVRSNRPGFLWREGRCVRPEEVVVSRWMSDEAASGEATQVPA